MKDKEARSNIEQLGGRIDGLEDKPKIFAKYCKKCKHDTAQIKEKYDNGSCVTWMGSVIHSLLGETRDRCLNCGTLWEEETVCKEVKERR